MPEPRRRAAAPGDRPPRAAGGAWAPARRLRPTVARARARLGALLPLLRTAGFVAAVAVVAAMVVRAGDDVRLADLEWWALAVALACAGVWWALLARGWALLAAGRPSRRDAGVWFRTQALRYLPGGVWGPVSRVAVVRGGALDRVTTVAAENVIALCAALAVGGLFLGLSGRLAWIPLAALVLAPWLGARVTARRTRVAPDRALRATANYVAAFVAFSLCAVAVQAAVSGLEQPLAVAGAAAVAWSAGLVVVVAPGGIGVREVAYVALLEATLPHGELVAAAVATRAVTVVAELVALVLAGRPARVRPPAEEGASA